MRGLARSVVRRTLAQRHLPPYEPDGKRVWLIRPDHLGDLLFLRPGLKRLRQQLPDWHITLMIGPWSRAVVANDPNVDEIVELPFPGFTRRSSNNPAEPYRLLFEAAALIREQRPRAVVILRDDHWWGALAARYAGVPIIVGSEHPEMRGLLTDTTSVAGLHAVARNSRILGRAAARLGNAVDLQPANYVNDTLYWAVSENDRASVRQKLAESGVEPPFMVIHPGSGAPVKLWPAERWAEVATSISRWKIGIVLTGSASEKPYLDRISALIPSKVHTLGGQTTIGELGAVFERSVMVAGVDSGPLHLAVAVGKPTVHLYGPSDVVIYGPWGDPALHPVIKVGMSCPECGNLALSRSAGTGCMVAIRVEQVTDAIYKLLRE
jgi:heptosyltransferase III